MNGFDTCLTFKFLRKVTEQNQGKLFLRNAVQKRALVQ